VVDRQPMSRRRALELGIASAAALTGCSTPPPAVGPVSTEPRPSGPPAIPAPSSASVPPTGAQPPSPAPGGPAVEVVRGTGARPEVALTFHGAGDLGITRRVLDILAQHRAKVTVLAVGTWLQESPDAAKMVLDGGHDLGNHTWSHPALSHLAPPAVRTEIERCRDRIAALTGSPGAWFRQSQGQHATQEELTEAGRAGYPKVLSYDVDSLDWQDPGPAAVRRATAAARAGSVVSMHLGHEGTVLALPGILTDLADRGLVPVTANELLR
jgi:peptidoglycan/xylan/chitin deacetylase (PgdA/CDA1 family)